MQNSQQNHPPHGLSERYWASLSDNAKALYAIVRPMQSPAYTVDWPLSGLEKTLAYTLSRIAKELDDTALGNAYYGNALRVAKDVPGVDAEERALLDRYATGAQRGTDHVALQQLAIELRGINP